MVKKKMGAPLRIPEPTGDPARDRVINLRRALGLSQGALGAELGVSITAVNKWELGRNPITGPALILLEQLERKAAKRPPAAESAPENPLPRRGRGRPRKAPPEV